MKNLLLLLAVAVLAGTAERMAYEYGLLSPVEYVKGAYPKEWETEFQTDLLQRKEKEYNTYVNVSIIEIAEAKAAKYKLKDYDGFVRQIRKEPDISLERVDTFRRNGNYIKEYEQYIKDKETKKTFFFF